MARPSTETPGEIRKRIQKCNYSIGQLMREMAEFHGTDHFIDWSQLVDRLKEYRSELEESLASKTKAPIAEDVAPEQANDFAEDEDDIEF